MSDYNSSLPIRTEANGDAAVKVVDGTTTSQTLGVDSSGRVTVNQGAAGTAAGGWFAKITDGTNTAGVLSTGEQKVSVTQALPTGSNTIGAVTQASGPWTINMTQVGGSALALGQTTMSASIPVTFASNQSALAITAASLPLPTGAATSALQSSTQGSVGAGTAATASTLTGGVFNSSAPTLTTGQQAALQLDSSGNLKTTFSGSLPAGTNNIGKVSIQDSSGSAFSATNPLAVQMVAGTPGTEIHNYNTAAAVAANATSNHDYAITASKTFKVGKFWAAASGKLKIEVQISPDGTTFTSKWVGFNSTSMPNIDVDLEQFTISDSGAGAKVRIIRTNLDKAAMDVYSTISGVEV